MGEVFGTAVDCSAGGAAFVNLGWKPQAGTKKPLKPCKGGPNLGRAFSAGKVGASALPGLPPWVNEGRACSAKFPQAFEQSSYIREGPKNIIMLLLKLCVF